MHLLSVGRAWKFSDCRNLAEHRGVWFLVGQVCAFFADLEETPVGPQKYTPLPTAAQQAKVDELKTKLPPLESVLNTQTAALDAALAKWEASQAKWTALEPSAATAANGTQLAIRDDHSILASGELPSTDTYTVTLKGAPAGTRAFRIEALPDDSLPKKGPGRAGNGNFVLSEVIVKIGDTIVPLQNATASFEQTLANENNPYKKWSAASAIDGDAKGASFGWAVLPKVGIAQRLVCTIYGNPLLIIMLSCRRTGKALWCEYR